MSVGLKADRQSIRDSGIKNRPWTAGDTPSQLESRSYDDFVRIVCEEKLYEKNLFNQKLQQQSLKK